MEQNTRHLEQAFNQNPEGIILIDSKGTILKANNSFLQLLGVTRASITDQKYYELLNINPIPIEKKAFISKKRSVFSASGTKLKISIRGIACDPANQNNSDYLFFITDITSQDNVLRDLERAYISNQVVLENNPLGIFIVNELGKIDYVNSPMLAMSGYTLDEFLALNIFELKAFQEIGLVERIKECLNKNHFFLENITYTQVKKDFAIVNITGIPLDTSAIPQALLFIQDNTKLVSAKQEAIMLEKQLHQSQKLEAIGTLAAGVAHEINTPIQFIMDNNSFLQDSCETLLALIASFREKLINLAPDKKNIEEEIKQIEEEADFEFLKKEMPNAFDQSSDGLKRVTKIVGAMRNFSHIAQFDELTKANINQAILETLEISKNEWKYVTEVKTNLQENLPQISCYIDDIKQVILNLIINASHAIKDKVGEKPSKKGLITITTKTNEKTLEISIADTGTGIDDSIKEKVFDPFFTTKPVGKGTGQGLSLAYETITNKHQGTITFSSIIGKGTKFIINLPLNLKPLTQKS